MSTFLFLLALLAGSIWIIGLMLFCLGLMHGHLKDRKETFGAQVNEQLKQRLDYLEERIDAAISTKH